MQPINKDRVIELLNVFGSPNSEGEQKAQCPWCGKNEFYINVNNNNFPFQCWRKSKCGETGSIEKLLKKLDAIDLLNDLKSINLENKLDILVLDSIEKKQSINIDIEPSSLPLGFRRVYYDEYMNSRGFKDYDKYIIGYTNLISKYKNRIIIAIEQDEEIKAYVSRLKDNKKSKFKYLNSKSDFSKLIFGIDEITSKTKLIIVVEGAFDKFNIDSILDLNNQEEIKCICTFGCKISSEQMYILSKHNSIEDCILLYDNDVKLEVIKTFFKLDKKYNSMIAHCPYPNKDAGDLNRHELLHILNNHLSSAEDYFSNTVNTRRLS